MAHMWMSHVTHIDESYYTYGHESWSHTLMNESCGTPMNGIE